MITIVTTCSNRLAHVKRTLTDQPTILVDYNCSQGTSDWVRANKPSTTLITVTNKDWCKPIALNIGLAATETPWVAFSDADTFINGNFNTLDPIPGTFYIAYHPGPPKQYPRLGHHDPTDGVSLSGFILVEANVARQVGGYNPRFKGWGGEDNDFINRLAAIGLAEGRLKKGFLTPIDHNNIIRMRLPANTSIEEANTIFDTHAHRCGQIVRELWAGRPNITPPDAGILAPQLDII